MDENSFIVGMQALIEAYLHENPNLSLEGLEDIIAVALEEITEEHFATMEADNDD